MTTSSQFIQQFRGCMLGGAIGDAWGSGYENVSDKRKDGNTYYLVQEDNPEPAWSFTDETQLTMATCEALSQPDHFSPELLAATMLRYYKERRLSGLGSATLKAMIELQAGSHWSQVGRSGEYAAGNGAAMRMAPFAFFEHSQESIRNTCRITHKNEEAYVGVMAVIHSIRAATSGAWNGENDLFELLIPNLPDTRVRDRLIEIDSLKASSDIVTVAKLGNNGYVINSVPFAIYAASQIRKIGFEMVLEQIIKAGGDTDTNASIAGQIGGALLGKDNLPANLLSKLEAVPNYVWVNSIIERCANFIEGSQLFRP